MKYKVDEKGRLKLPKRVERFVIIVLCLICLFVAIYSICFNISLYKHAKITNAVVIEIRNNPRGYVEYEYYIDGERYDNSPRISGMRTKVSVGDTIKILYDSINVSHSRPVDWSVW